MSETAWIEEKDDTANLRKAKRELPEDYDPLLDSDVAGEDDGDDPLRVCQMKIVARMKTQFEDRVIRRSLDSVDWRGHQLLNLPECKIVHGRLDLTERELKIINDIAREIKEKYV